ncbi:MAG: glycosyltransferase [Candidatus Omnitrophota bacterium]
MRYSLIIPVGPGRKVEVKDSIARLDYPKGAFEVIIEEGKNPSKNRNKAIKRSKGEIMLLLDDEAIFEKDLLDKADNFFKAYHGYDILGGPQLTPKTDEFFAKLSGIALASGFGTFKISNRYKRGDINFNATEFDITSANCFVKREVFEKIGYFHPFLYPAEEREFFSRAQAAGFKIAKSSDVVIYHKRRKDLWSFARQIFKYGITRPQKEIIVQEKPHIELEFILVALFSIYMSFLPMLLVLYKPAAVPALCYLAFIIFGGIVESAKNKSPAGAIVFPLIFFVIHFSYGWGLIRGFIKALYLYRNKRRKQLQSTNHEQ